MMRRAKLMPLVRRHPHAMVTERHDEGHRRLNWEPQRQENQEQFRPNRHLFRKLRLARLNIAIASSLSKRVQRTSAVLKGAVPA